MVLPSMLISHVSPAVLYCRAVKHISSEVAGLYLTLVCYPHWKDELPPSGVNMTSHTCIIPK